MTKELLAHAALAIVLVPIAVALALRDYHAEQGADVLAMIAAFAALGLGVVCELVAWKLFEVRAARYVAFALPTLVMLGLALAGGARKRAADERFAQLPAAALVAETKAHKVSAERAAAIFDGRGADELYALAEQPGPNRATALRILSRTKLTDRPRALAVTKAGLASNELDAAAVAKALADPSLVEPLRALQTKEQTEANRVAQARAACGDLTALDDHIAGRVELEPPQMGADAALHVEARLTTPRAAQLLGRLGDPHHRLDAIVFDATKDEALRKAAFDAWPAKEALGTLQGAALVERAKRDGDGAAAAQQLILLLHRCVWPEQARAVVKALAVKEALVGYTGPGLHVIRERAITLLGGYAKDEAAFSTLAKIAADTKERVELRACALESLALVDAARARPIAEQVRAERLNHVSIETAVHAILDAK